MVVIEIRSKDAAERAFIEHDHMVETFPPNGANHPFHVRPLPRRARRRQHFTDAHILHLSSKLVAEDSIAVAQQVAWQLVEGECLPQLLTGPFRRWVSGHIEVDNATTIM